MEIEVVRELERLAQLKSEWNAAVESSGFDSIFQTHEWFYAWAKNFAHSDALNIVVARNNGQICGIMPLMRERRGAGPWAITVLRSMSNLQSYKYGFVLPRENSGEILESMLRLMRDDSDWDLMILEYLPHDGQLAGLFGQLQRDGIIGARDEIQMESPYVAIEGTWDEYAGARDKKVRKNWDYFERRLEKEGSVRLVEVSGGADLENRVRQAFEIEKASWKGEHGSAIGASSSISAFYLDLASAMSERNNFRLCFLELDGKSIAFDYCLPYKRAFNVLKTGYDPAYSKNSPGRVLRKTVLRSLFQDGNYSIYDLLGVRESWKEEWTEKVQPLSRVRLYNRKPAALASYAAARAIDRAKNVLRRHPRIFSAVKRLHMKLTGSGS